jgi:hypothetical protein
MHTEDLFFNDGSNWEAVEDVAKRLPSLLAESLEAFVVESELPVDIGALVVASEEEEVLWIFDFECEQQTDCFDALPSPVNVISQKQIIGLWGIMACIKDPQQIMVLSVNITAYC